MTDDWEQVAGEKGSVYDRWSNHFTAKQPNPELNLRESLLEKYPGYAMVTTTSPIELLGLPGTQVTPVEPIVSDVFTIPPTRRQEGLGRLVNVLRWAHVRVEWKDESFIVLHAEWRESYNTFYFLAVLHAGGGEAESLIRTFLLAADAYEREVREAVLVYNDGYWRPDHALWVEVQKANWEDVILDEKFKKLVQTDTKSFFESEELFKNLGIPWKRGIIMYGPPGNGKTISTKAIMKTVGVPSLYVKSFVSYAGPERAIRDIFTRARAMAPCLLILEDLDSLIEDGIRSYFLNELDGLESNDGILLIGSTNHLDRLDPGLSKRPSRFDRKFEFDDPSPKERRMYCTYWQNKLKSNKDVSFPDSLADKIASMTDGFSFAYLKEAFVSSLVTLATSDEPGTFEETIIAQIKALRKEIGVDEDPVVPTLSTSEQAPAPGLDALPRDIERLMRDLAAMC